MLCGSIDEMGVWELMDTCVWMAESLHRSPEPVTILLICYTPTQNKKLKLEKNGASSARSESSNPGWGTKTLCATYQSINQ